MFTRNARQILVLLLLTAAFELQSSAAQAASLTIFWSTPIPRTADFPAATSDALIITDPLRSTPELPILLGRKGQKQQLIAGPTPLGYGSVTPLALKGTGARIARGVSNTLLLGGSANHRMYVPGGHITDAYLARIDRNGSVIAEHTFVGNSFRQIQDLVSLPTGEIVVAGRDNWTSWLAKISANGKMLWRQTFGSDKGAAVALIGDQIIVLGFDGNGSRHDIGYQENLAVWRFSQVGEVLDRHTVRADMGRSSSNFGRITIEPTHDSFYIFSSWQDMSAPKPVEVVKLDTELRTIWRKELSGTITRSTNAAWWSSCNEGRIVLESGDVLIACALRSQILLFQLEAKTGDVVEMSLPLPACDEGRAGDALFLKQRPDGAIWLFGSRPGNNVGASCTWLGELSLSN